jgi:rhodanese-related sulfurtransferase
MCIKFLLKKCKLFLQFILKESSIFEKTIITMNLSQEDWLAQFVADNNAVIIDVRTQEECNEGIIPNAINIDIFKGQGFIYEVDELDKNKNYYVYCKAGGRSAQACSIMNELGFENTYNLMGGFMQWNGDVELPKK